MPQKQGYPPTSHRTSSTYPPLPRQPRVRTRHRPPINLFAAVSCIGRCRVKNELATFVKPTFLSFVNEYPANRQTNTPYVRLDAAYRRRQTRIISRPQGDAFFAPLVMTLPLRSPAPTLPNVRSHHLKGHAVNVPPVIDLWWLGRSAHLAS